MRRFAWPIGVVAMLALGAVACSGTSKAVATVSVGTVVAAYTRYGAGPNDTQVDITYAPAEFYRALGQQVPADARSPRAAVFVYGEGVHEGDLPPSAPVVLRRADGTSASPATATVITESDHHRSTRLVFYIDGGMTRSLMLEVLGTDGKPAAGGEFTWDLPVRVDGVQATEVKVGR